VSSLFIDDFTRRSLCLKVWRRKIRPSEWEEFTEDKFDDESLSHVESAFKSAWNLVRAFRQRRRWEKAREQKTTSVVKRKHRGSVRVSLTRVTRRDVTWRDVTWRRGVEMPRDEMAARLGSLAPLFALLLCAFSGCRARITNQEIGKC